MREFIKSIRKQDIILLIVSFVILLFIDQYTKYLTTKHLDIGESTEFINGFLRFTYVRNKGASFGMLQGQRTYFIILTTIILPIILFFYLKTSVIINTNSDVINKTKYIFFNIALMLLFTGAVGNFIDRIRLSYVIDFLDLVFMDFPVFNMADCYVTVGTALMFVLLFIMKEKELDMIIKSRKKW